MALDHDYLRYYSIGDHNTILDLGATTGEFAQAFHTPIKFTDSLYIAVEPSIWNIIRLGEFLNRVLPENSVMISGAVTDETSLGHLNVSHSNVLHSTSEDVQGWGLSKYNREEIFVKRMPIMTLSLDDVIAIFGKIDFIKCDVEGAEVDIFRNFKCWDCVGNMAIASYHIINDEQTQVTLQPLFEQHFKTVSYEEGILYCRK